MSAGQRLNLAIIRGFHHARLRLAHEGSCDLEAPLGKSQPTVSHHLKVLYEAGLVDRDKRGSWIWYRVVPDRLGALRAALAPSLPVG